MSKLQINMKQSELLMAIRCILNCQNEDIIANITELKERDYNDEAIKQALFEAGYESARDELKELIERDTPKKPVKKDYEDDYGGTFITLNLCPVCCYPTRPDEAGCPNCLQRIDWSEELKNLHESHD